MKNTISPRQRKIAALLQQVIETLLQQQLKSQGSSNLLISVTKVNITVDSSLAKIFLSIFPSNQANNQIEHIKKNSYKIKHKLAQLLKNQIRKIPELFFQIDDSLDYIEKIDKALKDKENPIKNFNK